MQKRTVIALAVICALSSALFSLYRTDYAIDDAWITYRYAENLADGLGFVYNPGEPVLGTSTPLYTLLLAAVHLTGFSVPVTSQLIGFATMLGSIIGIFLLTRLLLSEEAGLLAAALLVSMQVFHRVSTYGMETPLYVCLIVFTFYAYATNRFYASSTLAAVCLLLRVDGLAVAIALFAAHVVIRRSMPWKQGVLYISLVAPWFVFSQLYFGSVLPNSFLAKQAHTHYQLLTWMPEWLATQSYTAIALLGGIVSISNPLTRTRSLPMVLWAIGYIVAYSLASIHGYEWYRTPLAVPLASFASVGILLSSTTLLRQRINQVMLFVALVALLVLPDAYRFGNRLRGNMGILAAEAIRYQAAHWIKDYVPKDVVLVTGGIGHIGYFTRNYVLDAMGLISPQVIRVEGVLDNPSNVSIPRFLPFIIETYEPEYVFDGFWLPPGQDLPKSMREDYYVVKTWVAEKPGLPTFLLMHRRSDSVTRSLD